MNEAKSVFEGVPSSGYVRVTAASKAEANKIIEDALNSHPEIYCELFELEFLAAEEKCTKRG